MRKPGRWLMALAALAALGLLAWSAYVTYDRFADSPSRTLSAGEAAYAEGARAFEAGKGADAVARFLKARGLAEAVIEEVERLQALEEQPIAEAENDRLVALEAMANWLKARALRGEALARLLQEGKSLPAPADNPLAGPATRIDQIGIGFLPDPDLQREAVICLRKAARALPDVEEIQRAAIATEISRHQLNWSTIPTVASNVLRFDARDERALYLMARYECQQPNPRAAGQSPSTQAAFPHAIHPLIDRRSAERMHKAQEYLATLALVEKPRRWRTLYVEAQVHQWLARHYRAAATLDEARAAQADAELRRLLFDGDVGLRRRIEQDDRLGKVPLSNLDREGLLGLQAMAMEAAFIRRSADTQPVLDALTASVLVAEKLLGHPQASAGEFEDLTGRAVAAAVRVRPTLAESRPDAWQNVFNRIEKLAERAAEKLVGKPATYASLAEINAQEAILARKRGQEAQAELFHAQAFKWVETGLRIGALTKAPVNHMVDLHDFAARYKAATVGKRDAIVGHVDALMRTHDLNARARALLLEGQLLEDEGRLAQAADALEKVVRMMRSPSDPMARQAHVILANVHLAMGKPDKALVSLREVQTLYDHVELLDDEERDWLTTYVSSPELLAAMHVRAHLLAARERYGELSRQVVVPKRSPRAKTPAPDPMASVYRALLPHEEEARRRLASLPAHGLLACRARLALALHFADTGRLEKGDEEIATLAKDNADDLDVLRAGLMLQARRPRSAELLQAGDRRIREFMDRQPGDPGSALVWAEWLALTGRGEEALALLEDGSKFAAGRRDLDVARDILMDIIRAGEPIPVALDSLTYLVVHGPRAGVRRVDFAVGEPARTTAMALPRYEAKAILACQDGQEAMTRGDHLDAARAYLRALEYVQMSGVARAGLLRAIRAVIQQHPEKAEEFLRLEVLPWYFNEPEPLIAYAEACLQLDRLGAPNSRKLEIRDAATALDAVEALLAARKDVTGGPMLKCQFWIKAGRSDLARAEAIRAVELDPQHVPALLESTRLALAAGDRVALNQGAAHLAMLKRLRPDDPRVILLAGRYAERAEQLEDALGAYAAASAKQPGLAEPWERSIALLERMEKWSVALERARMWQASSPREGAAVAAVVRVLARMGRMAEAREAAEEYVAGLATEIPQSPMDAASALRAVGATRMARAFLAADALAEVETWCKQALAAQPGMEEANVLLGDAYLAQFKSASSPESRVGYAALARNAYGAVYYQRKGDARAGANLAWVLAQSEDDADLQEAYQIVQEVRRGRFSKQPIPPERLSEDFIDVYGLVCERQKSGVDFAHLREFFEAARLRYPSDPRPYLHLARAYAGLGEHLKAEQLFIAAMQLADSSGPTQLSAADRQMLIQQARVERQRLNN